MLRLAQEMSSGIIIVDRLTGDCVGICPLTQKSRRLKVHGNHRYLAGQSPFKFYFPLSSLCFVSPCMVEEVGYEYHRRGLVW